MTLRLFDYDDYPRGRSRFLRMVDSLKKKYPNFKCNVFAIPTEMRRRDYMEVGRRPFLRLYPHGFVHRKGECRYPYYFRRRKYLLSRLARDQRYGMVFKPPWHGTSEIFCQHLDETGFAPSIRALVDFPTPMPNRQMYCMANYEQAAKFEGTWDFGRFVEAHPVYRGEDNFKARKTEISRRMIRRWTQPWHTDDHWEFAEDMLQPMRLKLHLGCGQHVWDGWANLDPRAHLDERIIEWDFSKQIPFSECKADIVFTSHVFNYVAEEKYREALLEIWRVLRPGGILRMAEDRTDNGYIWRKPGQRSRGTGEIRSLPTREKIYDALIDVGFAIHDAEPGKTMSPHKDVLEGDSRPMRYRRGHKFYVEAVKDVHHYSVSRVRIGDSRATLNGRYTLPNPTINWHPECSSCKPSKS